MSTRSLQLRTQPEFYDALRRHWSEAGLSEATIADNVAIYIAEAQALCEGRCPKCGAPSVRYVDYTRQQGDKPEPGAWVQYRCSTQPPPGELRPPGTCEFMVDIIEAEAAS